MERDELLSFLALSRIKGLSNLKKREIVERIPKLSFLFKGKVEVEETLQKSINLFDDWELLEKELEKLKRMDVEVLTIKDEKYPFLLRQIPDAPILLYKKGPLEITENTFAIVGTRRATEVGKNLAERIAGTLSSLGITIVSGLARGIDTSAHKGALKEKGKTIAVLGNGIDICYPAENFYLFRQIEKEGLLLTEYPLSSRPLPFHFPERNRIIAGLSKGILVLEASKKSGSLITARLGLEYGRDVMAVPGSIFDDAYKGSNLLIKEGARLVDGIEEILSTFPQITLKEEKGIDMTEKEAYIYNLIPYEGIHVEEIIAKSRMGAKDVMVILTNLLMKELIRETAGGFFMRK